jgi:hypothetical protein
MSGVLCVHAWFRLVSIELTVGVYVGVKLNRREKLRGILLQHTVGVTSLNFMKSKNVNKRFVEGTTISGSKKETRKANCCILFWLPFLLC